MRNFLGSILTCVFFCQFAFAQLTDFTLSVGAANETCTGNGSLTFTVSGTAVGASVTYAIYQLPNSTTPIAILSENTFEGLVSGTYLVIATQTVGSESNSQQQAVTINDLITTLAYQVSGDISCNDGVIAITVIQGIAQAYEIISGPVILPLQSSNTFTMLPAGTYTIRVFDACGDAVVQAYTLKNAGVDMIIGALAFPYCPLIDCNTIKSNTSFISTMSSINYPVTVVYTIYPPSGAPIVQAIVVSSGDTTFFEIEAGIPFFNNQSYTYDIQATDNCGNIFAIIGNSILETIEMSATVDTTLCVKNIKIESCNFMPPVTINYIAAPVGFNPILFNNTHPGPYAAQPISYISTELNVMPDGLYIIQLTDACGRSAQNEITLNSTLEPGYSVLSQPCNFGQITMPEPNGSLVASVIMTSAPPGYNHALPHNVSSFITNGQFGMSGLPSGIYTFTVLSVCGNTYNYTIEIPLSGAPLVVSNSIKGCAVGEGSIRIEVQSSILTTAIITAAPSTFPHALPYNVSSNLDDGILYMNGIPEGFYTFFLQDQCGERSAVFQVLGYHVLIDNIVVDANCGSFNIAMQYQTNESATHEFWLQRLNMVTGQWEHPITGTAYINGSNPDSVNSYALFNNTNNLNIVSIGTFRIIRTHQIFSNGSQNLETCIQPIKDFIFTGGPRIIDAYALPCSNGLKSIVIIAEGIAPLLYSITLKDNLPFVVSNGTSNVFTGLTPGLYNFQVQDICGNIVNRLLDLGTVPPPAISQSSLCVGIPGSLSATNFPFLNYQWWSAANPTVIISTSNTLNFTPFSATDSGTYFVRIYSSDATLCTDQILSYTIPSSGTLPNAGTGTTIYICSNTEPIDLFTLLTGTFDQNGIWNETTNSGGLIGSNWLPLGTAYGTYQFAYTVNGLCDAIDTAVVAINYYAAPPTPTATTNAVACGSNTIQLFADNTNSTYQYHWTGPNGFASDDQNPIITDAENGTYTVTAAEGSCISAQGILVVAMTEAPKFTIAGGCDENEYVVTVIAEPDSFNPATAMYLWTGPQNFSSTSNPIVISSGIPGIYTVTVNSDNGCSASAATEIGSAMCAVPAGISPNGDGQNDRFDLSGFDIVNLEIFNRYGRVVFEQDDYTDQWHGQDSSGRELPDATYYYYIRMKSGEARTGWVYKSK